MLKIYWTQTNELMDDRPFYQALAKVRRQRKETVLKYHFRKDQALSLAAELLLDQALADQGLVLSETELCQGPYGKPRFAHIPQLCFNLSHSGDFAVCGISDEEIGVDVEQITAISVSELNRYFMKGERAYLKRFQEERKEREFYRLWTLKESFMKAVGKGFSLPPDAFEICMEPSPAVRQRENEQDYFFYEPDIGNGYCLSVCSVKEESPEIYPYRRLRV